MLSKARFEQYIKDINHVVETCNGDVDRIYAALYSIDDRLLRESLFDEIYYSIINCGEITATLAAELYEELRVMEIGGDYTATVAPAVEYAEVKKAAEPLFDQLSGDAVADAAVLSQIKNIVDLEVKKPARNTIMENAKLDAESGVRFARVPSGEETCAFCLLLASRGFIYASNKAAGEMKAFHPHCDCQIVPSWGEGVEGYDDGKKYLDIYDKATDSIDNRALWDEWDSMTDSEREEKGYKSYSNFKTKKVLSVMREQEGIH